MTDLRVCLLPGMRVVLFFFSGRSQLRRASCKKVVPFSPKSKASLVLLRRERTSLVPRASTDGDPEGVNVRRECEADIPGMSGGRGGKTDGPDGGRGGKADMSSLNGGRGGKAGIPGRGGKDYIPGRGDKSDSPGATVGVEGGGDDGERWASAACPREGDDSEQFSRLVTAEPR